MDAIKKLLKVKRKLAKDKLLLLAAVALAVFIYYAFIPPFAGAREFNFYIKRGETLRVVAHNLKEAGLIKSKTFFTIYALVLGRDTELKAGRYEFPGPMSTHSILNVIAAGNGGANDIAVTIPEGFNIWDIDERMAEIGITIPGEISKFRSGEGRYFPDTYRFHKNDTPLTVLSAMEENFDKQTSELKARALKAGKNWGDIIILASLIEKEARRESDMRLVSDVLWKRLEAGMKLKVDAAVAYAVCMQQRGYCDVSKVAVRPNLDIDSRYNTYKYEGLPPGPISNPGLASLEAALNPQKSPYWYYLSTKKGELLFSKTGDEHERKRAAHILGL